MKSPRFDVRSKPLQRIFSPRNIEKTWREKVRVSLREQFLNDGIENFDFHIQRSRESEKLSRLILSGGYAPGRAQRILVEKSKGLCRQLVIPNVQDAIVLQCLSDALYAQIRRRAPTDRAFFEPREHRFSAVRSDYGTFASWLNFQRELFSFSRERRFIVVTDIANYYDSISYTHLRNVISGITDVEESVLDMLIYVLSDLLWQPDYSPRVEIGLPQINLDAPRLLAHCFLYELDAFLGEMKKIDFVRYMDDIDVGVDTVVEARKILQSIDLVLQTKQIRLNSGKTKILSSADAERHFRVRENARLDRLADILKRRRAKSLDKTRAARLVSLRLSRGLRTGAFDDGNGDKVLKRWLTLASMTRASVSSANIKKLILYRPSVREKVLDYLMKKPLSSSDAKALAECVESGHLVDDAGAVDVANKLVETLIPIRRGRHDQIIRIISALRSDDYFQLYAKLWLQSKYDTPDNLIRTIRSTRSTWSPHERLGRLVGSFSPLFNGARTEEYFKLLLQSGNAGCRVVLVFHRDLKTKDDVFRGMYDALKAPNNSRGTGITHAKFLCLLSALQNATASNTQKRALFEKHTRLIEDAYYKIILRTSIDG